VIAHYPTLIKQDVSRHVRDLRALVKFGFKVVIIFAADHVYYR